MFEEAPLTGSRELRGPAVIVLTALALVVAAAVYLAPSIAPPRVGPAPKVPTLVPRFAAVGEIQFTDARHGLLLLYTQTGQPAPGCAADDAGRGATWQRASLPADVSLPPIPAG